MREVWPAAQADDRAHLRHRLGRGRPVDSRTRSRWPRRSRRHGAAAIDVSTGQVTKPERPAFGRSYQTPYADAIRNRLGIPTIAVGVISSYDDVNSILMAGRADLCALGRVHLYDPMWTLHAAVEQDYDGPGADLAGPVAGRAAQAADRPHRRTEAAARADPRRASGAPATAAGGPRRRRSPTLPTGAPVPTRPAGQGGAHGERPAAKSSSTAAMPEPRLRGGPASSTGPPSSTRVATRGSRPTGRRTRRCRSASSPCPRGRR